MTSSAPTPEFVQAVKEGLDRLYDYAGLNDHPLGRWLLSGAPPRGTSAAQVLRQRLIEAIERLNPGARVPMSARQRRFVRILELRYLEALPFREVMRTLALSQTQYHREQRRAIEMLASYLWDTVAVRAGAASPAPQTGRDSIDPAPGDAAAGHGTDVAADLGDDGVHLGAFLADISPIVNHLAAQFEATVRVDRWDEDLVIVTSRTALRYAVIETVGYLLDGARSGTLVLSAHGHPAGVDLRIGYQRPADRVPASASAQPADAKLEVAGRMMQSIGGALTVEDQGASALTVVLSVPSRRTVLLVIEDNPDTVQLIARYLSDQEYTVLSADSVEAGMKLAEAAVPDAILLDALMPHRDGWDALQLLRHHPATSDIPVIMCTILDQPLLAKALGATAFLKKPLTRSSLIQALEEVRAQHPGPMAEPRAAPGLPARSGSPSTPDR